MVSHEAIRYSAWQSVKVISYIMTTLASSKPTYILSIDFGTQSVRAIIIDEHGNILAKGQQPMPAYQTTSPGFAELTAASYWQALQQACQQLWQVSAIPASALAAMTLTTQRGTMFCLDKDKKPLRPAIIWLDQRQASQLPPLGWRRVLFKFVGAAAIVRRFQTRAPSNWLASNEPAIWQQTAHYVLLSGYLSWRLTGELTDCTAAQVGYLPFNFKRQRWASRFSWKWRALSIQPHQLPRLVAAGEPIGKLCAEAAADLGLPAGLSLLAAGSDKACEVLGCGGLTPDIGCISYGTTATITTVNSRYVEPQRWLPAYPAAHGNAYTSEVMIHRGFWLVSWFKEQFGLQERQAATEQGIEPEQLFDALLKAVPAGSMGLMLQPYWSPGITFPGPEAKGAMIGFSDVHERAHVYRAIIEGLVYALKEGSERLQRRNGQPIQTLRVSGGGAKSVEVLQITANVFNLPVERPHTHETSALGAAISAMVGLGRYPSYPSAIAAMCRLPQRYLPDPVNAAQYQRLYREVYLKMYRQLQPLYNKIRDITGYPT
ncbi:FGGY-family carbohydrate kinase [Alishewanella sp. SMS8]|uniref:FGGY-family carbohydrate kinase n=1 Tax=Alishewanella sp. SMS8 TaxID=2994676 RepID=UPI003531F2A7